MRKALFLICILTIPCASTGQSKQASWQNLNAIQVGQKIQVIEMNSTKDSGTLLSVSDSAISLETQAGEHTVQRQDVRSVALAKNTRRLRNAAIGAGIGAGLGAAIGAASFQSQSCANSIGYCGRAIDVAAGLVIGLVAGVVTGALLPSHKTIYRVKAA